jgi:uncharacterized protein YjbI with pentapeptide repeats
MPLDQRTFIVIGLLFVSLFLAGLALSVYDLVSTFRKGATPQKKSSWDIRSRYIYNIFQSLGSLGIIVTLFVSAAQLFEGSRQYIEKLHADAADRRMELFRESAGAITNESSYVQFFTSVAVIDAVVRDDPQKFAGLGLEAYVSAIREYVPTADSEKKKLRIYRLLRSVGIIQSEFRKIDGESVLPLSNLSGVKFDNLETTSLQVPFVNLYGGAVHKSAVLSSNFNGSDLSSASLEGSIFTQTSFNCSKLSHTDFTDAKLAGAKFDGVDMTGASLRRSSLIGTSFQCAILDGVDLRDADVDYGALESSRVSSNSQLPVAISYSELHKRQDEWIARQPNWQGWAECRKRVCERVLGK